MARDSSLAKNRMMLATSSGMHTPTRMSECLAIWPNMSGSWLSGRILATMGVAMEPGHTALQRMPVPAKRRAVWRVTPTMAALEDT